MFTSLRCFDRSLGILCYVLLIRNGFCNCESPGSSNEEWSWRVTGGHVIDLHCHYSQRGAGEGLGGGSCFCLFVDNRVCLQMEFPWISFWNMLRTSLVCSALLCDNRIFCFVSLLMETLFSMFSRVAHVFCCRPLCSLMWRFTASVAASRGVFMHLCACGAPVDLGYPGPLFFSV